MSTKLIFALAGLTFFTANVSAAVMTYTDRTAFEAAAASYNIDSLNDITDGHKPTGVDRGAYSFTMNSFGCNSGPGQCGDNTVDGFTYPAYIWTYDPGSFIFDSAIYAFGLDYGNYSSSTASVILNGYSASTTNGGFFGIIDSNAFTTVTYSATGSGSLFDNVTYSATQTNQVPEPGALVLMGLGLVGLAVARRRNLA